MSPPIKYRNVTGGEDTFLSRYMRMMEAQETPESYDFWCGVWAISSVLGRVVTIARPRAPIYMNWYVLLVADSGVTRKSTAVRSAASLVRPILPTDSTIIEAKTTPEMLEMTLCNASNLYGHAHTTIAISELVTFLGKERYAQHMPGLLTDLYDSPNMRAGGGTIARGPATAKDVYVTFLSASTPAWLLRAVNPDVVEGGFTSRCIFVVAQKRKRRIAWPDETDMTDTTASLREQLKEFRSMAVRVHQIQIHERAKQTFTKWYTSKPESKDVFRNSFESREDAHVLRLAGILAINDGTWVISSYHVKVAIKLINDAKERGAMIFAGSGSMTKTMIVVDKLRDQLIGAGVNGVTQSDITIHLRSHAPAATIKVILAIMHELGMVQKFEGVRQPKGGRAPVIWRATNKITARNMMELVTEQIEPGDMP